jgi:hypothetical protein
MRDDQSERFKRLARDPECDEDEACWDERLGKLAVAKPSDTPEPE